LFDDGTIPTAFAHDCSDLFTARLYKLQDSSLCILFAAHGFASDPYKLVLSSRPW
jgi:hypothetical protein